MPPTFQSNSFWRFVLPFLTTIGCLGAISAFAAEPSSDAAVPRDRKVILVTGSTSGLGREVALRLAATGAHIIVHGRNRERGEEVVREIEADGRGSARFYAADFASLAEVKAFADAIVRDYDRLDVLINNAGIWLNTGDKRQLSADGIEMHFAVNYLAGFVLTERLHDLLVAGAPSRIINVASAAQSPVDFDDINLDNNYTDSRAYAVSKLAQVIFTFTLADSLKDSGVSVFALHPATLMDTGMVEAHGITPRATVADGAEAVLNLVNAPDLESGQYFNGLRPARANDQAYDRIARVRLTLESLKLWQ